ncbi:MAG: SdrD B-like domain-containing protein [Bacteroidota bacterium]
MTPPARRLHWGLLALLGLFATVQATPTFAQAKLTIASFSSSEATVPSGETFRLTAAYDCSSTTGNCLDGVITIPVPAGLTYQSSLGNGQTQNLTGTYDNGTRTVAFLFKSPLASGSVGELTVDVAFPNGRTPDGTSVDITASSSVSNGDTDSRGPVTVIATAQNTWTTLKQRTTNPPVIDRPIVYEVGFESPGGTGQLNLTNAVIVDTLPQGAQFVSADSGCTYDSNANTVTCSWGSSTLNVKTSGSKTYKKKIRLQYNTGDFTIGDTVTNIGDGTGTPVGDVNGSTGQASVSHDLQAFVADPKIALNKQTSFTNLLIGEEQNYRMTIRNTGNVDLDDFTFVDPIPPQLEVTRIQTGRYNRTLSGVIEYQTTANANWTPWTTFDGSANAELQVSALGLGAGEQITTLRWRFGTVTPGFSHQSNQARIFGTVLATDRNGDPVEENDRPENCVSLSGRFGGNDATASKCVRFTVSDVAGRPEPRKVTTTSGPYVGGSTVSFKVSIRNANTFTTTGPLINPIGMDLLPSELTYVANSWSVCAKPAGAPDPHFEQIDDYNGTGRTLLRWSYGAANGNAYALPLDEQVDICFDTVLPNNATFGDITNQFQVTSNNGKTLGCRRGDGSKVDINDLDGDGLTNDRICQVSATATVAALATLESTKFVLGSLDANYNRFPDKGQTVEGGLADYRLTVTNTGTVPVDNVIIYDILPFIGDQGVRADEARLSEWRPNLVGPVTVSNTNIVVYYSTQQNPCRPEVKAGGPVGCVDDWSTAIPQDITSVQSLKFEFGGIVLNPLENVQLEWPMRAPVGSPRNGEVAWNSFAFTAKRLDTNRQLPAAEPIKVGIQVYAPQPSILGDRVWYDFDQDGIQDADEPGFNGVKVDLYRDNGDGVPNTGTDTRSSFTFSGNDQNGAAGYYLFPAIDPADYFVQFTQPAGYVFTQQQQGGSTLRDSDVNPGTGATDEITVPDDGDDRTQDAGVYNPAKAAIGNFVWLDLDRDGIQDNSESGVPNVRASLFTSNGTFVDSLRTNSLGFYAFVDIDPGTYYVEFDDLPTGYVLTRADQGSDNEADSDANPVTGRSELVTVGPQQWNRSIDAGLIGESVLGDRVWSDDNRNGIQDDAETGVANVTVNLYRGDDTLLETTTTDANGDYRFRHLIEGDYYVIFEAPTDRAFTLADQGSDDAKDSGADPANGRTGTYTLGLEDSDLTADAGLLPNGDRTPADLALKKSVDNPAPNPGDEVTFSIVIENSGPGVATGVAVRDTIPDVLNITNFRVSQGGYDANSGIWTIGTLAVGETDTLFITTEVPTTDPVENFAEIVASDNPDIDSTPDNGKQGEDDEGRATVTAGSSSGGGAAGVESDGDMASKLATRLFHRRMDTQARNALWSPIQPTPLTDAVQAPFASKGGSSSTASAFDLTQIVPLDGPAGTEPFAATPTDILFITNAASVFAVDYLRPEGRRLGAMFAATSPGNDLYDHTKSTCDRLGGGHMDEVRTLEVDGFPFVMTKLVHPNGEIDYAVSLVAYKSGNSYTIDSKFSPTQYAIPGGLDEIVNVQLWSVMPAFTEELVQGFLNRLRQQGSVSFADNPAPLPPVFMHSGDYQNGTLKLRLINRTGEATALTITGSTTATESEATALNRTSFSRTVEVPASENGAFVTVEVPVGQMYDAVLTLTHEASNTNDRIYAADGPWGVAIGQGTVSAFETYPESRTEETGDYLVERDAFVSGSTSDWASLFRFLKPDAQPVNVNRYAHVSFTAYGQGRVQLVAEKASIDNGDHFRHVFTLRPQPQTYTIPFTDFMQANGGGTLIPDDLTMLVFYALGTGQGSSPFDIVVQGLRFGGVNTSVNTEDDAPLPQQFTLGQSYPNPFNPQTTIPFTVPTSAPVTLTVYDLLGRTVQVLVDDALPAGRHTAVFEAGDLASGTYVYRLTTPSQTITQTMVLLK